MARQDSNRGSGCFSLLTKLFLVLCVLIVGFALIGYVAGWVTMEHEEEADKMTIEVKTGEVKRDVKELFREAEEEVQEAAEEVQEEAAEEAAEENGENSS